MENANMKRIKGILKALSSIFIIRKIKSDSIFITFDDGPHEINTEIILKLLAEHEQKATFFVVGQELVKFPEIVKNIYQQGHSLGYHSYSHQHAKDCGFIKTWNDLKTADELEIKYGISFEKRYRPPYGALTIPTLLAILLRGWRIHLWSIDSLDSYTDTENVLIQISPDKLSSGEIILMHDDYKNTPKTLEQLLVIYKSNNISLAPVK